MALVGEAHILVKAITTGVKKDIERGLSGSGAIGARSGQDLGSAFSKGFNKSAGQNKNFFSNLAAGMKAARPQAEAVNTALVGLQKKFWTLTPVIASVVGGLISLGGGLIALGGAVIGAGASLVSFLNIMISIKVATAVAKMAFSGMGKALQALSQRQAGAAQRARQVQDATQALALAHERADEAMANANKKLKNSQDALTKAIRAGREEVQQLGFDSEDAAISEKRAAMQLEDARTALARVADLPPNSRARKEAELAYAEADLNLRRAKDRVSDLADEQNKIASNKGMTDGEIAATEAVTEAKQDLIKTERDNIRALKDAKRAYDDAVGGAPGTDPYAGLLKSQRDFVDFLMGEKPRYEELKKIVANGWLPLLQKQMKNVIAVTFPVFKQGITDITKALGIASGEIANGFTDQKNLDNLKGLFKIISQTVEDMGPLIRTVFGIMLSVMNAVQPTAHELLTTFTGALKNFETFINSPKGNKSMTDFFNNAGIAAQKVGTIVGNVFGGLMTIISEMVKPGSAGQKLLDWLVDITEGFSNIGKTDGATQLNTTLNGMADTVILFGQALGSWLGALKGLGSDPGIQELFKSLAGEAPLVQSIADKFGEVAPKLGPIVHEILRIVDAFADSASAGAFFDVLTAALKGVADFLEKPSVKSFLEWSGPLHATGIALSSVGQNAVKAFDYLFGGATKAVDFIGQMTEKIEFVSGAFGGLKQGANAFKETMDLQKVLGQMDGFTGDKGFFGKIKGGFLDLKMGANGAFTSMSTSANGFTSSLGKIGKFFVGNPWLLAIMLLVGAIVTLYTTNEEFRKSVDEALAPVLKTLGETFNRISTAIQPLITAVMDLVGETANSLVPILELVVEVFAGLLVLLLPLIATIIEMLVPALTVMIGWLKVVITVIMAVVNTIVEFAKALFSGDWESFGKKMGEIWNNVWKVIQDFIKMVGEAIGNFIKTGLKNFDDFVKSVGKFFGDIGNNISKAFKGVINFLIGLFEGFLNRFINGINNLMGPLRGAVNSILKTLGIDFTFSVIPNVKLPRLAKGGVVMPSDGGSIVNVAEAGRPERIEPLDASGLSQRDRALIEMLSKKNGGGGNGQPITLNVYPSAGMDERDLAEKVSRQLQLMMRKGAVG